ncbi:Hypothetical Protein FCC1311_074562 [Hondaea fermentalgiana]|uniref:Uncharacterized protein n=1 Tax=Hondaea fermentalgiana TaxID=2315210 RepID=A0A2R5GKS5_9STRA|nr:Hypothetical Protein FCC1311_074562 [Hondaea fermentalgiana]|eukprot:GBG31235.1 Hypothetical Protein FCC1311_074562 [Hondaea fermentalgiana]
MEGDYEARRLANIRRNAAALRELGLAHDDERAGPPRARSRGQRGSKRSRPSAASSRRSRRARRSRLGSASSSENEDVHGGGGRRSGEAHAVDEVGQSPEQRSLRRGKKDSSRDNLRAHVVGDDDKVHVFTPVVKSNNAPHTEYELGIEDETHVYAPLSLQDGGAVNDTQANLSAVESWVGKVVGPGGEPKRYPPKQTVMYAMGFKRPRFNKYGGVQKFRNCYALFVNATPVADHYYANLFRCEVSEAAPRLFFSWFTQARLTIDSPLVHDLASGNLPVYLFVRLPAKHYFCVGRVRPTPPKEYENQGVHFWWIVEHAKELSRRRIFHQLVETMGTNAEVLLRPFASSDPKPAQMSASSSSAQSEQDGASILPSSIRPGHAPTTRTAAIRAVISDFTRSEYPGWVEAVAPLRTILQTGNADQPANYGFSTTLETFSHISFTPRHLEVMLNGEFLWSAWEAHFKVLHALRADTFAFGANANVILAERMKESYDEIRRALLSERRAGRHYLFRTSRLVPIFDKALEKAWHALRHSPGTAEAIAEVMGDALSPASLACRDEVEYAKSEAQNDDRGPTQLVK